MFQSQRLNNVAIPSQFSPVSRHVPNDFGKQKEPVALITPKPSALTRRQYTPSVVQRIFSFAVVPAEFILQFIGRSKLPAESVRDSHPRLRISL